MLLQNPYVSFSINGALGTNIPPYHHRCSILNFMLVTIWMVLYLVSPEESTSMIFLLNFDSSDHSTHFHFLSVHLRRAQALRGQQCCWMLLIYSFCRWQRWTVFIKSGFSKCSWTHVMSSIQSCQDFNAVLTEGPKVTGMNCFHSCPVHAKISPDSLDILMILWTVDSEIPTFLAIIC